ncbi:MAG: hypothetical protein QM648_10660 [Solirubrobacterales bacterium]
MAKLLSAFTKALQLRDHEALDVQLAPWISVADAIELAGGNELDVFVDDKLFSDVAERLSPRIDELNFLAWARIGDFDVAVVEIARGLYVGYIGRD